MSTAVEIATSSRAERRQAARATLGLQEVASQSGEQATAGALRPVLREYGVGLYPMVALGVLGFVDLFQASALVVMAPDVRNTLGLSFGLIGLAQALGFLAQAVAPLPMAALARSWGRRGLLCLITALGWSVITVFTGFVTSLVALILVLVADGLSTGSVNALHPPLLADTYPPRARIRVLAGYRAITVLGQIVAPLLVALLTGPFDLTWRGVFLVLGGISVISSLCALGIRDPKAGRFDTEQLHTEQAVDLAPQLGFVEILRRILLIPTIQRICAGTLVFGMIAIPFTTFLSSFLVDRWHFGSAARGVVISTAYGVAIIGLLIYSKLAENTFANSPSKVVEQVGYAIFGIVFFIAAAALMPNKYLMVAMFAFAITALILTLPGLNAIVLSIVDARYRPHAAAMIGISLGFGAILGVLLLNSVYQEYGSTGTMIALLIPGTIGSLVVRSAGKLIDADIDRMIDTILEEQDLAEQHTQGVRPPLLAAKSVNFSYGKLQVLFDVDFTVDDGEMVALLGTNGAGKSTLLKVISGIGLPSSGSLRLDGDDITYLDAERRVRLGISQIPGGRAVFRRMTVIENLRGFGYTLGADKKAIDDSIERCLTAFPRLGERRASLGATLSGGEQQMLGLCKALILEPRLLLIDELSLGLAPVVVGQLLDLVREINSTGTAVVLVEQSVNIALSLVDHAYFMEKGEMRFDGAAADLLRRDDLLRAVFLEGATKAGAR
ncbi:MAG TPA: MFS transporter [Mycobacteriales bacterium]|jgi:ABC-type branched-subunit amino acid transport system ATPase component/MFS family permease|nr:MFS transporter [Mycobacteriales bacterium]